MTEATHPFVVNGETLQSFSELDYRIYSVIHDNGEHFVDLRVMDLAHQAHVSNAAVVRFCKKCGYSGLKELKQAYSLELSKLRQEEPFPSVLNELRTSFDQTGFLECQQDIRRACKLIESKAGVVFVGHGRSAGLAAYGTAMFNDMEFMAVPLITFPVFVPEITAQGVAVIVSHSGSTPEVVAAANDLSSKGCRIVAITSRDDSPVAQLADIRICYGSQTTESLNPIDLSTRIPAVYAIEQIARTLYNARIK